MSEVDRLSNSGLYPALPIADKRGSKDEADARSRGNPHPEDSAAPKASDTADSGRHPRPPKSLIDEYA